ncbi:50S ribosomal protein L21 [Candidatus Roizmanbacteria bacterium]|nr:50S ribosomal protein L21 [Candidatus Roizmanbacteria bacterium]
MSQVAVIKTGGKQYFAKINDILTVDRLAGEKDSQINLEILALFDDEKNSLELGSPLLAGKASAQIIEQVKGDKIRIAKFKAKVRYRRVRGFRAGLSQIKIVSF